MQLLHGNSAHTTSMVGDESLKSLLKDLAQERVQVIIETGTYRGLGSSTFIAEAFRGSRDLERFFTCEVDLGNYLEARKNLKRFPFVQCCYGSSIPPEEAIRFIAQDEAILQHQQYPDVFIDDVTDPVRFYTREMQGTLFSRRKFLALAKAAFSPPKERDLLRKLIRENASKSLLVVLDSAGGVGLLEFNLVRELLHQRDYWLLLDDTKHLKHFRSLRQIKVDPAFRILGENAANAWVLCQHMAQSASSKVDKSAAL